MGRDTKTELLDAATRLFAQKGFYGASIANIADELGLTKQALLHHFDTKEALYAAVLHGIAERIAGLVSAAQRASTDPAQRLEEALVRVAMDFDHQDIQLVVRELLDNKANAAPRLRWILKPVLEEMTALAKRVPGLDRLSDAEAFAMTHQLLGASQYFRISETTLSLMFGDAFHEETRRNFEATLRRTIRSALEATRAEQGAQSTPSASSASSSVGGNDASETPADRAPASGGASASVK